MQAFGIVHEREPGGDEPRATGTSATNEGVSRSRRQMA